jgi:O-antigen biosynthesis protein
MLTAKTSMKQIVVVIGMHRSGTSAISRGLLALGVDLGDNLTPGLVDNNEKGFWEDLDVNALNIEILNALNHDWHTLAPIREDEFSRTDLGPLLIRAVELLRQKTKSIDIWGIKDPRIARLLPFWKQVFRHVDLLPSFIIALRNPLSVAQSLKVRDGFNDVKSYYLWLEHMVSAIIESGGHKRVVVDFDRLMDQPEEQLRRISAVLDLHADDTGLREYTTSFLEERLRHSRYKREDLLLDPFVPKLVSETYAILDGLSRDEIAIDAPEVSEAFTLAARHLDDISPALFYAAQTDMRLAVLNQTVTEKVEQIAELNQVVVSRDQQITSLAHAVAECNSQIKILNLALGERDGHIEGLTQALGERDGHIEGLTQALWERDNHIAGLAQIAADLDVLNSAMISSRSWRITRPLRFFARLWRGTEC